MGRDSIDLLKILLRFCYSKIFLKKFLRDFQSNIDLKSRVYMVGSEREAEMYQTTITLFREDEYGRVGEAGYSAQRSYTGQVCHVPM